MKSKELKQKDLVALTESLQNSKSAMVVSFTKLNVTKDQEFRNRLREAGAKYQVVKNTLARIAVKGTEFEQASGHFKGVTAIAWTENDPVVLSKAISKFMKDNADVYTFKTGVVDGRSVDIQQLTTIANLPSKEELISKLLFVINAQAQRLVTVINAVPRDLVVVIKQIGDQKPAAVETKPAAEQPAEVAAETPAPVDEVKAESPVAEPAEEAPAEEVKAESPAAETAEEAPADEAPAAEPSVKTPAAEAAVEPAQTDADEAPAAEAEAGEKPE